MQKRLISIFVVAVIVLSLGVAAFAVDEGSFDVGEVLVDSFTGMVADLLGALGLILPIALSVFGAIFAIKMCMKIFKGTSSGATSA
ncbi:hypothetical protein FACS189425_11120 [Clostridia bacterium]|nr:hypothetical protein FACS189425_11120 [Clostridia bacterium]